MGKTIITVTHNGNIAEYSKKIIKLFDERI